MKILVVSQALDLSIRYQGITPSWWQIMKGINETGVEVVAVPYVGRKIDTLWWRSYQNPNLLAYLLYDRIEASLAGLSGHKGRMNVRQKTSPLIRHLVRSYPLSRWRRCLTKILEKEKNVDAILILTVPLNHFTGLPREIKERFDIPVIYYDGDTPASLPRYGGLSLSYYDGADVSEYDAFIVNSRGVVPELLEMGAKNVYTVYWGVDPQVFAPSQCSERNIDVSFYGIGSRLREDWIQNMIAQPSLLLEDRKFVVGGLGYEQSLGKASLDRDSDYVDICHRSKICLNIVRKPHAEVFASSNARIFELASMGCCIVSNPYNGIEEWFRVGKEVFVVHSAEETIELYRKLLSDDEMRMKAGLAARERVLKEHTNMHRSRQILEIVRNTISSGQA